MILLVEEFAVCQTVGGMGKARLICFFVEFVVVVVFVFVVVVFVFVVVVFVFVVVALSWPG